MQVTEDYKIFKKIDSNRDINKGHLKKLISSIKTKNLLYLFPVIINKMMEVVDGQHRIEAAKSLGIPIYYIIDNDITKGDIAMMNSNRKSWSLKDYIEFYAKEGNKDMTALRDLLHTYPKLNINASARLMDENITSFYQGGAFSNRIRGGRLTSTNHLALAKSILALADKLHKKGLQYAFNGFFLLDIKNAIVQSKRLSTTACDQIWEKRSTFPTTGSQFEPTQQLRRIKDILGVTSLRPYSSKQEVSEFLERESIK